jgi:hypothetical protein
MLNSSVLDKKIAEPGSYAISDVVVKLKSFEFRFRREPEDFVPDSDFMPFFGRRGTMAMVMVAQQVQRMMMLWTPRMAVLDLRLPTRLRSPLVLVERHRVGLEWLARSSL